MRKIFLFIVAALFATSMWAANWTPVDTVPYPTYMTDFSFDEKTRVLTFSDNFHADVDMERTYLIELFGAVENNQIYYYSTSMGNNAYYYGAGNETRIGSLWTSRVARRGGVVSQDISRLIDSCYTHGYKDVFVTVSGWYREPLTNNMISYYNGKLLGAELNNHTNISLPALAECSWRDKSYANVVYYDQELSFEYNLRGVSMIQYTLQRSTDMGNNWSNVDAGYVTTLSARKGTTLEYKYPFNKNGEYYSLYRLIAECENEKDTIVRHVMFRYRINIADKTSFEDAGETIILIKPADCRDYRITSDLPVINKKIDGEFISYTMPACNIAIEDVVSTYTVKFLNADYSLLKTVEVTCGDDVEAPADPTYGNYTFIGWNKDLTNVHSNMSVVAKYDIGNDYDLNVSLDEHKNKVFPADYFEGSETRAMVGDVLTFKAGIFAVTDATLYYETAQWNLSEQKWIWPSQQEGGKKVGDYTAKTTGLLSQDITVCYDANTQFIHPFEHRLAVRFYLLIAGVRVYSEPFEFDVYYPIGIKTSTSEGVLAENNAGDIAVGTPVMIPARSNDTIRVYGMNGSGGACFTYRRVIKSSMAVDNGVDEEDNAYFIAPGELDTIVVSVAQTAVVFEVPGQGKSEYSKYGQSAYYVENVDCGGSVLHMPEEPAEDGAIFQGWQSWESSEYLDDAYLHVPSGFDIIGFTAQFEYLPEVPQYQVRFYGKDGDSLLLDTLVNEGENAVPPMAPEIDGFHFVGWDKPYTTITANTDITALYGEDGKTWTVTYKNWDNSDLGTETVNDGEAAQGVVATREGYTFTGWSEDISSVKSDMTVTAQFAVSVYTITYTVDGAAIMSEQVNHGAMPTAYLAIEDQGKPSTEQYVYTFDHWNPAIAVATEDASYEAVFTESLRKYTVRFQNWDHTLLKEEPVEYGKAATAPADPVREGYTFKGWDRAFNNIITDMTVTAVFEKNKEQGLEDIRVDGDTAQKVLVDGTLYIALPDGRIYNANGLRVK